MATAAQIGSQCGNPRLNRIINKTSLCLASPCDGFVCNTGIKAAIDAESIGPFIRVGICNEEEDKGVTVGNRSSPDASNRAVVSSMQYGQDNGMGAVIEIIDEEGGTFHKFFDKILDSMKNAEDKYIINLQWGWVSSRCDAAADSGNELPLAQSCVHTLILTKVNIKVESVLTFTLECTDLMQPALETRHAKKHGTDAPQQRLKLKDAIKKACELNNPPIKTVEYRRRGQPTPGKGFSKENAWDFKDNPKCVWEGNQQNILALLHRWIRPFTTDQDKGIKIAWRDTNGCKPTLVLWEDGNPKCNEESSCEASRSIGNYIVNGGRCSPVLEFNPQIKWNWAVAANTGGHHGKSTSESVPQRDKDDECDLGDTLNEQGAGSTTHNVVDRPAECVYGKQAAKKVRKHDKRHHRANRTYESIRGELRIQGDPSLDDPIQLKFATAGIIVINPFHLSNTSGIGCPEWLPSGVSGSALADSTCNGILSNKCWIVNGVSHEIRLGSYTTTLNLFLPAPGSNINKDLPMGGCPGGHKIPSK